MRFREDKPEDLARARSAVTAWREQNPQGTADQLVADLGGQFHPDYAVVLRSVLFTTDRQSARTVTGIIAARTGARPVNPPRMHLVPDEEDQVLRLLAFRAAHPEVIIGDGGFGTWQARIPEPNGETVTTRYTLREVLDRLDELTAADSKPDGATG